MKNGKAILTDNNFVVNADDLCRIIKECAKSKVRELNLGALNLAFGPTDQLDLKPLDSVETKPLEQAMKISEEERLREKEARFQDELDQLRLTDPLAYEKYIAEGDLKDVDSP